MNRRSLRTKREISESFLELLAEKPIQRITVMELTDRADISRATFYTHFKDVYDLLDYTRSDAIEYITELINKALPYGDIPAFTYELFSYFDKNRELFALIIGENGDISFLANALRELRRRQIERLTEDPKQIEELGTDEETLHYKFIFYSGGVLHILTEWAANGCSVPVEEIARITAEFIGEESYLR